MRSRSYVADERALTTLASSQGGFFTSKQPPRSGIQHPKGTTTFTLASGCVSGAESFGLLRNRSQRVPT